MRCEYLSLDTMERWIICKYVKGYCQETVILDHRNLVLHNTMPYGVELGLSFSLERQAQNLPRFFPFGTPFYPFTIFFLSPNNFRKGGECCLVKLLWLCIVVKFLCIANGTFSPQYFPSNIQWDSWYVQHFFRAMREPSPYGDQRCRVATVLRSSEMRCSWFTSTSRCSLIPSKGKSFVYFFYLFVCFVCFLFLIMWNV